MKLFDKKEILPIVLILAIFAVGIYFLPQLPERVPTHWGVNGEVNGWSSKTFAVYFFPGLTVLVYLLLSGFPLLDPLKKNIEVFASLYFWFKVVFVLFMGGLFGATIYAGLGYKINVAQYVMFGIALLFLFIGLMLPKVKRNYTIGIRLPWTLHSEEVWDKTHQFGGKLFIVLAILVAGSSFCPGVAAFWTFLGSLMALVFILMAYSYLEFKKLQKKNE